MPWNKHWEYAMYKGDKLLAIGTKKEICEQLGIAVQTFNYYRTNAYKKRVKERKQRGIGYRTIIKLEDYGE